MASGRRKCAPQAFFAQNNGTAVTKPKIDQQSDTCERSSRVVLNARPGSDKLEAPRRWPKLFGHLSWSFVTAWSKISLNCL